MGTRWVLEIRCPQCGFEDDNIPFIPTCDFMDWKCPKCDFVMDLLELTGISYEDASNVDEIAEICDKFRIESTLRKLLEYPPMYGTAESSFEACAYCHKKFSIYHMLGYPHVKEAGEALHHELGCVWRIAYTVFFGCKIRRM